MSSTVPYCRSGWPNTSPSTRCCVRENRASAIPTLGVLIPFLGIGNNAPSKRRCAGDPNGHRCGVDGHSPWIFSRYRFERSDEGAENAVRIGQDVRFLVGDAPKTRIVFKSDARVEKRALRQTGASRA